MNYLPRLIDGSLARWAENAIRKPLLLRGARQVGKSRAVRHLSEKFKYYIEINFEQYPDYKAVFRNNLDINRIVSELAILTGIPILDGETLIFFDEIQFCPEAIMALRFFREDRPALHVVAAGSLLEFTLAELPTYGVGRIHSMYMYPMTFDEYLLANGGKSLIRARDEASSSNPLSQPIFNKLIEHFRTYLLIGGMPEVVGRWVATHDYNQCREIQNDIISGYEDDFAKYRKKVDPELLRRVFRSAAVQLSEKFKYSNVSGGYSTYDVRKALELLEKAGLLVRVVRTHANGLPLGSEVDDQYFKILTLDPGLTLCLLSHASGDDRVGRMDILSGNLTDLVNKGPMAEMVAGLELIRYRDPNMRQEIFYWTRLEKNSTAEIDYLIVKDGKILPVEVKAGSRGGMKSLWMFMDMKKLTVGVRCSLENFGLLINENSSDREPVERLLYIYPLFAMSRLVGDGWI